MTEKLLRLVRSRAPKTQAVLLAAFAALWLPSGAFGQSARLEGSWSGGGSVTFATGSSEAVRCRAHYSKKSNTVYTLRGTCATSSARVSQTATLNKVGTNSYRGSFYNSEYDVSGTIHVIVHGNSQSVRLSSSSGGATLTLTR
ncbi:MAG: hypothetical protein ACREC6_07870 [Hyphomicrobiaceae bacterium]